MGVVAVTGFNNLGSQSTNGGPQTNHFSVWSGIDSISYTRGAHLFKFGGEIHDTLFSGSKSLTNDNGTFDFGRLPLSLSPAQRSPLEDFLSGYCGHGKRILVGNPTLSQPLAYNRYALFAQDDWRIRPTNHFEPRRAMGIRAARLNAEITSWAISIRTPPSGLVQETGATPSMPSQASLFAAPRISLGRHR